MRNVLWRSAIIGVVVIAAASVGACSGVSSVIAGTGTPPQNKQTPYVVTRSHTETLTTGPNLPKPEVSQQCDVNEGIVGGGYREPDGMESYPTASHPTANGWMAKFIQPADTGTFTVTVYAQCLVGGAGRVSVQSVSEDIPALTTKTVVAQCPAGSTAIAGGYAIRDDINTSAGVPIIMGGFIYALGGGAFLNRFPHDVIAGATAFVICYTSTVSVSVVHDHAAQLSPYLVIGQDDNGQDISYQTADYNDTCQPGASMTAGGYATPTTTAKTGLVYQARVATVVGPEPQSPYPDLQRSGWEIYMVSNNEPFPVGNGIYAEFACAAF